MKVSHHHDYYTKWKVSKINTYSVYLGIQNIQNMLKGFTLLILLLTYHSFHCITKVYCFPAVENIV